MTLSLPDLEALREKARAATKGPWLKVWIEAEDGCPVQPEGHWDIHVEHPKGEMSNLACANFDPANAEYVTALSPDVALALIEELIALRKGYPGEWGVKEAARDREG